MPVKGWTLPGVMSVGGAQTLLKQAALGADDAVFVGSGPLLYLTAWQYIKAGLEVRAVIDITGGKQWRSAIPFAPLALLQPNMLAMGRKWLGEIYRNTEVINKVSAIEIIGESQAQGVSCTLSSGDKIDIDANHIFLHQGVVPNVNLTMATGLAHQWDHQAHCWRPVIDVTGKSSDEQIYIAGDGGGIGGAKAAAIAGRLAASAIVARCGKPRFLAKLYYKLRHLHYLSIRPFLDRLYLPPAHFRLAQTDETIICRCEAVSKADVNAALASGASGPNQLKAFCRAGMGRCQGRSCGLVVQEMIASHTGQSMPETGYYRLRPPVKPITLAELASLEGPWPN
jgi:bacterioferritin-associated ferredoxin